MWRLGGWREETVWLCRLLLGWLISGREKKEKAPLKPGATVIARPTPPHPHPMAGGREGREPWRRQGRRCWDGERGEGGDSGARPPLSARLTLSLEKEPVGTAGLIAAPRATAAPTAQPTAPPSETQRLPAPSAARRRSQRWASSGRRGAERGFPPFAGHGGEFGGAGVSPGPWPRRCPRRDRGSARSLRELSARRTPRPDARLGRLRGLPRSRTGLPLVHPGDPTGRTALKVTVLPSSSLSDL